MPKNSMALISEQLLSYLWQHKKFDTTNLYTEDGLLIEIVDTGQKNPADGPDFMQVRLRIDGKLWAGSAEIDVLRQNWELHGHHLDPNYNNVLLHVIYQDSKNIPPAYRKDGTFLPVLNLKKYVSEKLTDTYKQMQEKHTFIPCEKLFMPKHVPAGFTSSLLIERMIEKTTHFYTLYQQYLDWQEIFWIAFVQGLGYAHNADAFMEIAQSIPFKIIQKYQQDSESIEALLFGAAGLLEQEHHENEYYTMLKNKWLFLQQKHELKSIVLHKIQWRGVRPANFATLRLMTLAKIIVHHCDSITNGFSIKNIKKWYHFFEHLPASHSFWDTHYTFTEVSPPKIKKMGRNAVDILLINAILPVQFLYYHHHDPDKTEDILQIYEQIPAEKNHIIEQWQTLGVVCKNAYDTQAWLQVYKKHCLSHKCLSCKIGHSILNNV